MSFQRRLGAFGYGGVEVTRVTTLERLHAGDVASSLSCLQNSCDAVTKVADA